MSTTWQVRQGDALEVLRTLPERSVQTCVTSPPYFGLRDYGTGAWDGGDESCDHKATNYDRGDRANRGNVMERTTPMRDNCTRCGATRTDGQVGLEATPDEYVARLVEVFREVKRVLRDDGTLWLNLGDSYAANVSSLGRNDAGRNFTGGGGNHEGSGNPGRQGSRPRMDGCKPKDLLGIPWMVAFALRADGWYLRSDIVWAKPNPMPESVTDRPTKSHEYVFLLSKGPRYFYDADAVREASEDTQAVKAGRAEGWSSAQGMRPEWMQKRTDINNNNGLGDRSEARRHNRNKRSVWTVATAPFSWRKNARRVRVELDDVDDGTERITSRDCPVHGDRPVPVPTESHGGREGPDPSRSPGTDAGHAREQLGGFAPTAPLLEPSSEGGSSGSPAPGRADSATPRSTRSRRTDPVPATSSACTPSAETAGRTGDTSASPETPVELRPDTRASRTLSDGSADRQSSGTPDRTAHKSAQQDDSACTCRYYRLDETDHFAVFPPKLIEPCVLAGSAEDACRVCGAPWVRVVEREGSEPRRVGKTAERMEAAADAGLGDGLRTAFSGYEDGSKAPTFHTVGFEPSCSHQDKTGSSTVLDCFSGAGTTGLVATRLGRSYIGIELNESYAEMSRERIRDDAPLMNYILEAV